MPYRRRKPKVSTRRRRPTTARKVAKLTRAVRSIQRAEERKFLDAAPAVAALTDIPETGNVAPVIINEIAQGDAANQRNGNKCLLKSVQFDVWLSTFNDGGAVVGRPTQISVLNRFLVVWFPGISSSTATQLTLGNVLEDPRNIQSFYKRDGSVNYKVLCDKYHRMEFGNFLLTGTTSSDQWCQPLSANDYRMKKIIPLKKQATFDGAATDPEKGVLCYYVVAENNSGSPTYFSYSQSRINTRLTWTDD